MKNKHTTFFSLFEQVKNHAFLMGFIFCSIGGLAMPSAAVAAKKDNVRIAMAISPLSSPFIIAREKGFFKQQGVNVDIKQVKGGHLAFNTMLAGEADIATSSEAVVMFNSFKRDDFSLFSTFVTSDNDVKILARADSNIKSINDLRVKKVGTIRGTSAHFFLYYTLLMSGIAEDEISTVNLKPNEAKALLENKMVDAVVTWEPFAYLTQKELGDKVKIINHDRVYVETFNAITMKDYASNNQEILQKITRALIKATEFIKSNNDESIKIVAKVLSQDLDIVKNTWPDFMFSVGLNQWLITGLETEARWAMEQKFIEATSIPNYINFINTQPLEKTEPKRISIFK